MAILSEVFDCLRHGFFLITCEWKFWVVTRSSCHSICLFVCHLDNSHFDITFQLAFASCLYDSRVTLLSLCFSCFSVFVQPESYVICCCITCHRHILCRLIKEKKEKYKYKRWNAVRVRKEAAQNTIGDASETKFKLYQTVSIDRVHFMIYPCRPEQWKSFLNVMLFLLPIKWILS